MKTILFSLLAACALTLSSCGGIPEVGNRDDKGRFIQPDCPVCQAKAASSATLYNCVNGHEYRTAFQP